MTTLRTVSLLSAIGSRSSTLLTGSAAAPQVQRALWMGLSNYSTTKVTVMKSPTTPTLNTKNAVLPPTTTATTATSTPGTVKKSRSSSKAAPILSKKDLKLINQLDKQLTPTRPPSAYTLFIKDQFASNKGLTLAIISNSWKELPGSAKQAYEAKATEAKKAVEEKNSKLPVKPKRPITPFVHYVQSLAKLNPDIKYKDLLADAATKWKSLSEHEKKSFYDMTESQKASYEKSLKVYNEQIEIMKKQLRLTFQQQQLDQTSKTAEQHQ